MRQRSFLDDAEPEIKPRRARLEEAISDDPLVLLGQMQTVMYMPNVSGKKLWHARARGCSDFGNGNDPMEAMQAAMRLKP